MASSVSTQTREARSGSATGLLSLWIVVAVTGIAGLAGYFRRGETAWPKALAFGWFVCFATTLVIELVRRHRAARLEAEARRRARRD